MLTKKEDIEGIEGFANDAATYAFLNPGALSKACREHNPAAIVTFIDQTDDDGNLRYARHATEYTYYSNHKSILFNALSNNYHAYSNRYRMLLSGLRKDEAWTHKNKSKYGELYATSNYLADKSGSEEFEDTRSEDERRNTELTLRIILQKEKERIANDDPELEESDIAKKLLEDHYETYYISPLHTLAKSGPACGDIRIIIDELGVENMPFELTNHPTSKARNYQYTPMKAAVDGGNFKMLEIYLTEYFKMKYEGGENESLYKEIKNYLCHHKKAFTDVIRMLPKNIAEAKHVAVAELQEKHGEDFEPQKLNKEINKFEEKIMPDINAAQMSQRRKNRNYAIGWSFTIIGAPIAWIWYAVQRAKEPISARQTTLGAYEQYLEGKEEESSIPEEETTSASEELEGKHILNRIRKKEPVKQKAIKEGKAKEWRTHKVVNLSDDNNVTVFCNRFNDQASNFEREIKTAEREVRRNA